MVNDVEIDGENNFWTWNSYNPESVIPEFLKWQDIGYFCFRNPFWYI